MTRYVSDQNKLVVFSESGTYGVSGIARWPGEVTDVSIDDNENRIEDRFLGNLSRSYGNLVQGPVDETGTITLNPQDMYFMAHTIGSVDESNAAGTNSVVVSEINSDLIQNPFVSGTTKSTSLPFSFSMEDSKQAPGAGRNSVRLIKGCVINTVTLNLTQGEKASIDLDWMAQSLKYTSGGTTAITASSVVPYLWNDTTLTMFGSSIDTAKDISFEVNNNITAPHYINGSRVVAEPFMGNRDYTLNVTTDLDSSLAQVLYEKYHQGGSEFIVSLDLNADVVATGSKHATFVMSGCKITSMERPSTIEGVNEQTLEIRPKNVSATIYEDATLTGSYNPF